MATRISDYWSNIETVFDPTVKRPTCRLVIMLPGAGCEWAKKSGGCYMCGFNFSTRKYSRGLLLPKIVFKAMINKALLRNPRAETIAIYNGGSFLNPREIPEGIPDWLCKQVAHSEQIKQLFIESRPEYIEIQKIHNMLAGLGSKELKVGIGLECATDDIRAKCVHKGFSRPEYDKAVHTLKSQGVRVLTYVLLKPLFLSEAEAIEEAVKTINYAFEQGSDEVALESAFVQKGTLMDQMFQNGDFKPPWLWSILEVVKQTCDRGFVYVGGFTDEPPPIASPSNCSKCSQPLKGEIQRYRETYDPEILNGFRCDCRAKWLSELNQAYLPFQERIRLK